MKIIKKIQQMSIQSRASIVYTIASLFTKGISFITLPIFTRVLSTADMGVSTTFSSWYTILYPVATLSIAQGSLNVAFMKYPDKREEYQSSVLTLSTICSIFLFVLFIIKADFWSKLATLPKSVCYLLFLVFIFTPATDMWMARQRYEYKYKAVALVTILSAICSSLIALAAIWFAKQDGDTQLGVAKLFGQYGVLILIAFILYFLIFFKGKKFYNKNYWTFALKLSLPLIIHTLAKHVMDVSDRVMIANMVGQREVGIYGVLQNVSMASLILWTAINNSFVPYMFEKLKKGETKDISKVIEPLFVIFGIFALALTIISPEIVMILATKEYMQAIYIMPTIAAGVFLTALYNIYANVLLYHGKTKYIMIATIVAASANVTLNYLFIPRIGYMAAAYTTLFSNIILAVLQYFFCKKIEKREIFNTKMVWVLAGIVVCLCLLCNLLYSNYLIRYIIIGITVLVTVFSKNKIIYFFKKLKN